MATYFYPATAECQAIMGPYPDFAGFVPPPIAPNNTMGGYGGLLDINDYNGSGAHPNLFISPADAVTSLGINDLMPPFNSLPPRSWYLMRQVDFKDWSGIGGIFWRPASFIMEIDILPAIVNKFGGYRDEAANSSGMTQPFTAPTGFSPYGLAAAQGNGISLEAIVTDSVSHLEVVKASHVFTGANGEDPLPLGPNPLIFPRQVVQLNLSAIKPDEIPTMVLRIKTEQYAYLNTAFPLSLDSIIYRVALLPDSVSLRSAGKLSAAMTSR
jgi:hypothetical protein